MIQNIAPITELIQKTFVSAQRVANTRTYKASAIKLIKDLHDAETEDHREAKSWLSDTMRCARDLIMVLPHPASHPQKNGPLFTYDVLQKLAEEVKGSNNAFYVDRNDRSWSAAEFSDLFKTMINLESQTNENQTGILENDTSSSQMHRADDLARSYTFSMLSTLHDMFVRSALIAPKMKGARTKKRNKNRVSMPLS